MALFGGEDQALNIVIRAQNEAGKVLNNVQGQVQGFKSRVEAMQPAFRRMAAAGTIAFAGISTAIGKTIQEAGDAEKIAANFENTFGESSKTIKSFIQDFGNEFAFVESEMMDGANAIGFQLNAMGDIGKEQGEEITQSLLTASGALSDFFGSQVNVTEAANAMAKGLAGNRQQLVDMGFNVLVEDIEDAAEAMGMNTDEMTKSQEAMVFTKLIMEQTEGSVEGLNTTLDTFTGQQRALRKATKETAQTLGAVFIPMATDILQKIRPVVEKIAEWIEENPELARNIIMVSAAVTGLVAVIGVLGMLLPGIIAGFGFIFSWAGLLAGVIGGVLVGAVIAIVKNWDLFKGALDRVIEVAKEFWNSDFVQSAWLLIKAGVSLVWEQLKMLFSTLKELWNLVDENVIFSLKVLAATLGVLLLGAIMTAIGALYAIIAVVRTLIDWYMNLVHWIESLIRWFGSFGEKASAVWKSVQIAVADAVTFLSEKIAGFITDTVEWAMDKLEGFINMISDALNKIKELGSRAGGAIGGAFGSIGSFFGGSFQHGGRVPGPVGRPVPIIAHGQEQVIPANGGGRVGGGATIVINWNNPIVRDEGDFNRLERMLNRQLRSVLQNDKINF